jgi:hypothetical protein
MNQPQKSVLTDYINADLCEEGPPHGWIIFKLNQWLRQRTP